MFQVCLRTAETLLIEARNLTPVHRPVVAGFSLGSLAQVKTCSYPTPLAQPKRRDYIAATIFVWTTKVVPEIRQQPHLRHKVNQIPYPQQL